MLQSFFYSVIVQIHICVYICFQEENHESVGQ